jgi:serine-aspartate repeat-containing protein C/D/E
LGDKVFSDLNNNGTQDAGEYGIAGVTVSLFRPGFGLDGIAGNADDALAVASMITDGKGNYFFSNLIPGDYQLEFTTIPTGMLFTQQNTPGDNQNNTNSDAIPANANGRTGTITLSAGETDLTIDAGLTVPRPATIGNFVWDDFNTNGIQDANEAGVGGFLVVLYNSVNQPIGSALTNGNGYWQITNIPAGTGYYVIFSPNLPAFNTTASPGTNPAWTTQNLGANGGSSLDSGTESDVDSDVTATGANAGRTAAFNIVAGNNFPNIDAGIINWARGNVLPIQLVSFTAQPQSNNVQLNWVVATETNVATYQVLYSSNGTSFSSITSQPATGSRNYSQLHTTPQPGLNYYRLKVIDIDGSVSYSEIRKVNFGKAQDNIVL